MEKKKIRLTCLLILLLMGGLRSTSAAEGAIQQKSVLVISSYSYEWTLVQDELPFIRMLLQEQSRSITCSWTRRS